MALNTSSGIRADKNVTASAPFGVAAILVIIGLLGWSIYGPEFTWLDWVITFSGAIYIILGIVARWARLPAASIGAGLYATLFAFQALDSVDLLMTGLIFKIPIAILLLVAVVFARKRPAAN